MMGNPVLQRLVDERAQANDAIDRILDQTNDEERDPSESERELIGRYRSRLQELEPQIGELLDLEETRNQARDARGTLERTRRSRSETPDDDGDDDDGNGNGEGGEPTPEDGYASFARFARDQLICRFSYIGAEVPAQTRQLARQRLDRAVEQVLTANVTGLIQPQYIAQIMQVIDKSRPIIATARRIPLSSGKVQYPMITTRPTVAEQVTEKTEVGDGSMVVTVEEKLAKTFLTAANFSWQTVQWSNPDALALWFDLAAEDYAQKTEADVAALLAAADATPTVIASNDLEGYMAALTAAAGAIYSATGRRADTVYADVTSGYELLGLVSGTMPVFLTGGSGNLATGSGSLAGLQLVISGGLPANTIVVGDSGAILVAETGGAPVQLRAVEPSIGGIEVGIIGAMAADLIEPTAFAELTPPA